MAKQTLLEMTQEVLSSIDGDEVNSITDSTEADQVVTIIKRCYEDLISNQSIPELEKPFQLTALGDTDKPTHMRSPTTVDNIEYIKYNIRKVTDTKDKWETITYLDRKEFLDLVYQRDSSASDVVTVTDFSGVSLYVKNDKAPDYYTLLDDDYIIFDSYDSAVDSTLQQSKSMGFGKVIPTFTRSDSFTPTLDSNLFPLLINSAKTLAYWELKQQSNPLSDRESRRQGSRWQSDRHKAKSENKQSRPDYSRRR